MWSVLNSYPSSVTLSRSIFLSAKPADSNGGNAILNYCGYLKSFVLDIMCVIAAIVK
jgi:hypothetical protein